jgi:hypothetical protein
LQTAALAAELKPHILCNFYGTTEQALENSKKRISRGLKSALDERNKRLFGTTEVVP